MPVPAGIQYPYWLTDDAISASSWSYTNGISYYSAPAMLHSLIDRVSKNGNMLLNISPMIDGTIPQGQKDVLNAIGTYLKRNGESIYSTRAWTTYGEGPTKMGGGSFTTPRAGTAQDIRYTRSKDNTVLYATVLGWPGNGASLNLASLANGKVNLSNLSRVEMIGNTAGTYINLPNRNQDGSGLHITLPNQPYSALAYVVKLTFNGQIGSAGTPSPSATPSVSPSASPSVSPSASPSASSSASSSASPSVPVTGACSATIETVNSWPGGFQSNVTVRAGSSAVNGWTVKWTWPGDQTISSLWNGTQTVSGSSVTVRNADYNGSIAAGGSTTFGFTGNGTAATPTATCTSP
ncbi:cellulose binding domain-containing protein [Microbispora sp. NBRC 16548]|uniref:cellulose binding domain-containing protein n=1 Tax=Microbispora sp. NBRC 16548 TaxID=3030994 RepID=UPI003327DF39